jgi:paraquat-inducible protein A
LRAQADLMACSECGLVQSLPPAGAETVLECARCNNGLTHPVIGDTEAPLVFSAAALILLIPASVVPLMSVVSFGIERLDRLPTGVEALWSGGFAPLASVIFLCSIGIPFVQLALLIWVLAGVRFAPSVGLGRLFRWANELRPWAMLEVYLVGCCVAYTRLQDVGNVRVEGGGWCLLAATVCVLLTDMSLNERSIWRELPTEHFALASGAEISCPSCQLLLPGRFAGQSCPRCRARLYRRKPNSLRRATALVIAGFALYLPANLLPVLSIERFGREEPNTILGGVGELVSSGLWPLAVIVFMASILVPVCKLFGLSLLLILTFRQSPRWLLGRTRAYRFIEFIGRWSSIDLFMISILVALVQFGALTRVRPEPGAIAFAAVVIVTMFASRSFDPRLMWDRTAAQP